MKLLKNLGWFLLAVLSFFFGYGLVQSTALSALGLGASIFGVLPLYIALSGAYVYGVYRWYQTEKVSIQTTAFNRHIWLPTLVLLVAITAQFFLPEDPSVSQQIVSQLTVEQPAFGFFMVVVFAPLTEELIFRGMLARYLFPKQDKSKQVLFLLVSSVLFALIHFPGDLQQFLVYSSLGFSLGLAYISRKGLVYSISLHALNNLVSFLMILML